MRRTVEVIAPCTPRTWLRSAAAVGMSTGLLLGARSGDVTAGTVVGVFLAVLAVISVVDLKERRIPNAIVFGAVTFALIFAVLSGTGGQAVGGLLLAGGVMGAVWLAGRGRLGFGDVKLSALSGTVLGLHAVPTFLTVGVLLGAGAALVVLVLRHDLRATLPYGPWLAIGAAVSASMHGVVIV